jgi:hypothetical protein
VLAANPTAIDGDFVVYHGGDPTKPWPAYCDNMSVLPAEFLTLPTPNIFEDWSQILADPGNPREPKLMTFSRVRIDPASFVVNVSDLTFAIRSGDLTEDGVYDPVYASVASCKKNHGQGSLGTGAIDLRGTPFRVDDTFDNWGYCSSTAIAVSSESGQVVELVGDGQCGWTAPVARAKFFGDVCWRIPPDPTQDPNWSLQLAFVQ